MAPIPSIEVLNTTALPAGTYTVYFGIDTMMNGILEPEVGAYDSVTLTVEP